MVRDERGRGHRTRDRNRPMIARGQRGKRWRWRSELLLAVFMNRMRVGAAADKTLSRERRRVVVHHGVRMTRLHCLEPCWSPTSQWGGCQLHERTSAVDATLAGNRRAPSAQGLRLCGNKAPNEFATAPRALGGVLSRRTVSHCSVTIPFDRYTPATFDQRASGVQKVSFFHLPLVRPLLCSSDASRREHSIAPFGFRFR